MKKIVTLFASVMLVASAFAQFHSDNDKNYDNDRDVSYNERGYRKDGDRRNDRYTFSERQRDIQISEINRDYNRKIETVKHRLFMSRSKKEAIICSLDNQRRNEIRMVYEKFNHRRNRFDDHDSRRHW